jgi:putative transposase
VIGRCWRRCLHRLPRDVLKRVHVVVRPDTVLGWHRDVAARRPARRSRPGTGAGRAPRARFASWCCGWSGRIPAGGIAGCTASCRARGKGPPPFTVWEILHDAGIDPAPGRSPATWAGFLRSPAGALLAGDLFETVTLSGARLHVLAVIEHASRTIRIPGATARPAASRAAQAARNLVMDLDDAGCRARFVIKDRDGTFPGLFGAILADAGIDVVLSRAQMPRMNSITERRVQTCQRELVDRTPIWNQSRLLPALREFGQSCNGHRPHQGIANARPLQPLPVPWWFLTRPPALTYDDATDSVECFTSTTCGMSSRMRFPATAGL